METQREGDKLTPAQESASQPASRSDTYGRTDAGLAKCVALATSFPRPFPTHNVT